MPTAREQLRQEIETTPEELIPEVLTYIRTLKANPVLPDPPAADKPLWQVAQDLMQDAPPEVLDQLPTDGARNPDHYLYGAPKRSK